MSFWSSQKLEKNLARLTSCPDADMVDCNALTLRIGSEIYITPGLEQAAPQSHTKKRLTPSEPFAIPPGRFAFLLTEETITIPPEVMGFISIKASFKAQGLVNVSGFHVDPGFSGPLIFTVFNAGPATIQLERGLRVFLLWIADLDETSVKRKTKPGEAGIPPRSISVITGVVDSIYALEKRLKEELTAIGDKQEDFRKNVADLKERQFKILVFFGIAALLLSVVLGVGLKMIADRFYPLIATAAPEAISQSENVTSPVISQSATPATQPIPATVTPIEVRPSSSTPPVTRLPTLPIPARGPSGAASDKSREKLPRSVAEDKI